MAEASRGSGGNLRRIAMLVAIATALSKLAGLFRQQAIAAAFGVGAAYDAFNYAYVLPGFLLILLGGINGPFFSRARNQTSKHALPIMTSERAVIYMSRSMA